MSISKILLSMIFLWPIVSIVIHILLPKSANKTCQIIQGALIVSWLLSVIALLALNSQPLVMKIGGWISPFGISLVSDQLSQLMMLVFATVSVCISFYSYYDNTVKMSQKKLFYIGFWLLLLGISGALFTADIFNLYVWFEVILVSAFILLGIGAQQNYHAIMNYALINIIGTLIMLLGIALIYGVLGSLSYAEIAYKLTQNQYQEVLPILCLLLFSIGLKGAVFPLYFWLPKAYPKTSRSSMLLLSSLITKAVMVVLLRLVWLWPPLHAEFIRHSLLFIALATMFFGVMGAASQFRFKDILAFHIISQLGYILFAIILPSTFAIIAAVYFIIHNVLVKTNLFMVASVVEQHSGTSDLKKLGGLLEQHKWLGLVFFLSAISLAGFPPLSGFWGKLFIIKAALDSHFYGGIVVALVVSLFTLYSMIKIWRYVFCEKSSVRKNSINKPLSISINAIIAIAPLFLLPILMGLCPDVILSWLKPISYQLQHPENYIHLILRG